MVGVNQNTISQYCTNTNEPDFETLEKLCKILEISPNDLFEWEQVQKEKECPIEETIYSIKNTEIKHKKYK